MFGHRLLSRCSLQHGGRVSLFCGSGGYRGGEGRGGEGRGELHTNDVCLCRCTSECLTEVVPPIWGRHQHRPPLGCGGWRRRRGRTTPSTSPGAVSHLPHTSTSSSHQTVALSNRTRGRREEERGGEGGGSPMSPAACSLQTANGPTPHQLNSTRRVLEPTQV